MLPTVLTLPRSRDITVLDMDALWPRARRVVKRPDAQRALNIGMTYWCRHFARSDREWNPKKGPWYYGGIGDHWEMYAEKRWREAGVAVLLADWGWQHGCPADPKKADAWIDAHLEQWSAEYDRLLRAYYPRPFMPDWYRCYGACHCLAAWNATMGQLLFPTLNWWVVAGKEHSTALGCREGGPLIFDILWGHDHSAEEILKALGRDREFLPVAEALYCLRRNSLPHRLKAA